jgi:hypothetical protein
MECYSIMKVGYVSWCDKLYTAYSIAGEIWGFPFSHSLDEAVLILAAAVVFTYPHV